MYFVISNFEEDFSNEIYILNTNGYFDITNYEIFNFFYNFPKITKYLDQRIITFSFKNDVKQKNYLNFQLYTNYSYKFYENIEIATKTSNIKLEIKDLDTIDISQFKNETINICFNISSTYEFKYYEILIYYSDYGKIFPVMNKENSLAFIPSIKEQNYYIFVDIEKAYRDIFLTVNTSSNFTYNYYLYETNNIEDFIDNYPISKNNTNINYSHLEDNLFEIPINNINESYKSVLIEMKVYSEAEYKVKFFKSIKINHFQNYTFKLDEQQRFIIYNFNNPNNESIYTRFNNGNFISTNIFLYYDIYQISFNKKISDFDDYDEKNKLNTNVIKYNTKKERIFILISNLNDNFSDTIHIINPNSYYDITQNKTFQYYFNIPYNQDTLTLTFSFNNKIKNKNFLNYQVYNYQNKQIDNTNIIKGNSLENIPIEKYNYGGIINISNYKNDFINITFNISSENNFNSMIVSIYYSNYKNLYQLTKDNNYYFYIPSTKNNEFFIYADISNIYKKIFFLLQTKCKDVNGKFYFYETNDINEIYLNLPNNESYFDGYYHSQDLGNDQLEIFVNKSSYNQKKSILLKMEIKTNTNISLVANHKAFNIKPFENKTIALNESSRYIIYEFDNEYNGTIYIYFDYGNNTSTKVTTYYDIYEINIDEDNGQLFNFKDQKVLNQNKTKFLSFKTSNIGKIYFVFSNFDNDYYDKIYIMNNCGYYDITKYEYFNFLYNFEKTNNLLDERIITFSFKNDIKQKNYLYYQINGFNNEIIDNSKIKTKFSQKSLNIEEQEIIDIGQFKNETINIQLIVSSNDEFDSFEIMIFYSDYKNIFELKNTSIENNSLKLYSIKSRQFYIFIDISRATEQIILHMETKSTKNFTNIIYFKENNNISEIDIDKCDKYYNDIKILDENNYEINSTRYWEFNSVIFVINLDKPAEFNVKFFKKIIINSYSKEEFELNYDTNYKVYEYNKQSFSLLKNTNEKNGKIYIYFDEDKLSPFQINIYKNYSDININPIEHNVTNSFIIINLKDKNIIELDDIYEKLFIVVSNYINKNHRKNSNDIIKNNEYYDITSKDNFLFNFKFYKSTEKQYITFKIDTSKTNYKYLHFQITNHQLNQIEDFSFKTLLDKNIDYKNNCINLKDNINETILMNFGLSSKEPMDNYDIFFRQSNYYLIYPFESKDIIEIKFIKFDSFYIFSTFPENNGYTFIFNSNQNEIEYYYLKKEEFNENEININDLDLNKVETKFYNKSNNTIFSNLSEETRCFSIKNKKKAVVFKININNNIDFKISREIYIDDSMSKVFLIIIIISIIIIILIIGFIIFKIIKIKKKDFLLYFENNKKMEENLIKKNDNETQKIPNNDNSINNIELNEYIKNNNNNSVNVTPNTEQNYNLNNIGDNNISNTNNINIYRNENNIYNSNNNGNNINIDNKNYDKPTEGGDNDNSLNAINNNISDYNINNIRTQNSINSDDNNFAPPPIDPNYYYKNKK